MVALITFRMIVTLLLLTTPLLMINQTAMGQAYTTQTITTPVTMSQVNTVTVGTSTLISNLTQLQPIFAAPFTIPATHGVCGVYFIHAFNATSGAFVIGNLTASSKVDFYIMTNTAYQAWNHQTVLGGNCTPGHPLLGQHDITSYNFTLTIPANDLYQIIVNNLSHSTVNAQLTVNFTSISPSMTTITMYSTSTQPVVQSLTLITLVTPQQQGNSVDAFTLALAALVIVIILVAIALAVRAKRGKTTSK